MWGPMPESKTNYGFLAVLLSLAIKIGGKALPILIKLAKAIKFGKISLLASFGAYAIIFNWKFALVILVSLFVHEYGHVWAMKREGMKIKGVYFIPFLGAAAITADSFPSRSAEIRIAIMGPIWGGLLAIATFILYHITNKPMLAAITGWMALLNLFNLLPIMPLDGGRIMRSISTSISSRVGVSYFILSCLLASMFAHFAGFSIIWLVILIGMTESIIDFKRSFNEERCTRLTKDIASALGIKPKQKIVTKALNALESEHQTCLHDLQQNRNINQVIKKIDEQTTLCQEPFRALTVQGFTNYLDHFRRSSEAETQYLVHQEFKSTRVLSLEAYNAIYQPWFAFFDSNLQDAKWLKKTSIMNLSCPINILYTKIIQSPKVPMRTTMRGVIFSALGASTLAAILILLLIATQHIPGADIAMELLKS
jgi:Zn-dependent protease